MTHNPEDEDAKKKRKKKDIQPWHNHLLNLIPKYIPRHEDGRFIMKAEKKSEKQGLWYANMLQTLVHDVKTHYCDVEGSAIREKLAK